MTLRPTAVLLALALGAIGPSGPAAETPSRFCTILKRVVAAAAEPTPFASLRTGRPENPNATAQVIPGFQHCQAAWFSAAGGQVYSCGRTLPVHPPSALTVESLAAETERCLRMQPRPGPGDQRTFETAGAVIRINGACTANCDLGRFVFYVVEPRR